MTESTIELSDNDFINQFQRRTLDPEQFSHTGHMRIAWLYLHRNDLREAINLTCRGIKSYAESLGANDKFHHTVTEALVRLIFLRVQQNPQQQWHEFLEENQDLVCDSVKILHEHYSKELLHSEQAKRSFVAPDIRDIQ